MNVFGGLNQEQWMVFALFAVVGLLIYLLLAGIVLFFFYKGFCGVPPEYRRMRAGLVWLGLIPVFQLFWAFITVFRISDSYRDAFERRENTAEGDCGRKVGFWFALLNLIAHLPLLVQSSNFGLQMGMSSVSLILSVVSFVLMVVYLIRIFDLRGKLNS